MGEPSVLNPKTYHSSSGEYACTVDPSDLYGRGGAEYRLTRRGETVWSDSKPFTLYDAAVTDEGLVAGYAYTHGMEGFSEAGDGMGEFQMVILDATGKLRLHEKVKREHSQFLHTPPNPLANGLIVDGANDRLVVRVRDADANRRRESWWTYRLSTGQAQGRPELVPGERSAGSPLKAVAIPGTTLALLHYWRYVPPNAGARFALVDTERNEVWSLTWPKDYAVPGNGDAEDRLRERIWTQGAILGTGTKRFDILCAATSERVTFSIAPDAKQSGKWLVQETARVKHTLPLPPEPELPAMPERVLRHLGNFTLQDGQPSPPPAVRNVMRFDFDDQERIGLLRRENDGKSSFALVDSGDGRLIREVPLKANDAPQRLQEFNLAWVAGDRWVVTRSDQGVGGKASAWWLDAATGQLEPIRSFECAAIKKLTGSRDGGIIALTVKRSKYSMEDELVAFDPAGNARWRIKQDYRDEHALFSPEDVAVMSQRQVAVLDNIRKGVQFFGLDGQHLRTVRLEKTWGREPNYPTEISADKDGGVLIRDFGGSPPVVRMSASGNVSSEFPLKQADGRSIDPTRGVKVSPSGRVWACDGASLVRVTDKGEADRVLGAAPSTQSLGNMAAVTVDQHGRLYAADDRTGAVHVYDQAGTLLRVCKPAADDFSGNLAVAAMGVTEAGAVFLSDSVNFSEAPRFVHFAPSGQRLGQKHLGLDPVTEQWHPLPVKGRMLVLGYHDAFIVDSNDKVVRKIQRRPDRNWLERPQRVSVAPDGSFAIVSCGGSYSKTSWFVNVYSPEGEPIRTVTMPGVCREFCFAFTGRYLATCTESEVWLFSAGGEPVLKFAPPVERFKDDSYQCFATHGGRELWLVSTASKKVARFELP